MKKVLVSKTDLNWAKNFLLIYFFLHYFSWLCCLDSDSHLIVPAARLSNLSPTGSPARHSVPSPRTRSPPSPWGEGGLWWGRLSWPPSSTRPYLHLSTEWDTSGLRQKTTTRPFQLNVQSQLLTFSAVGLGLLLSLLLLELHVAKVHDGAHDLVAAVLLIRQEAQDVHGVLGGRRKTQVQQAGRGKICSCVKKFSHQWPSVPERRPGSPPWLRPESRSGSRTGWTTPAACLQQRGGNTVTLGFRWRSLCRGQDSPKSSGFFCDMIW